MMLDGKGELHIHGPAGSGEEPIGHRHHEQLHLPKVCKKLLVMGFVGGVIVPEGAVFLSLQKFFRKRREKRRKVTGVTGEIYAGASLRTGTAPGLILQHRCHPFLGNLCFPGLYHIIYQNRKYAARFLR